MEHFNRMRNNAMRAVGGAVAFKSVSDFLKEKLDEGRERDLMVPEVQERIRDLYRGGDPDGWTKVLEFIQTAKTVKGEGGAASSIMEGRAFKP